MVVGAKIDFNELDDDASFRSNFSYNRFKGASMPAREEKAIDTEISSLLQQGVITLSKHEKGEFISDIFTREKKDGSFRVILNLREFNTHLSYKKFKMETFKSALSLISPCCFMASIDLVSAYYSVPIRARDRKYLKFSWRGKLYSYTCFPNGLSQAPRNFTLLTKPIYAFLHRLGHISTGYLDDSLLVGKSFEECQKNIDDSVKLFDSLGFVIHPHKSVLKPMQKIDYLGFEIDSVTMTVTLTSERQTKIIGAIKKFQSLRNPTVRQLASLTGIFVSTLPAVPLGPLHYRSLEKEKIKALKRNKGQWEGCVHLSHECVVDINWWTENIPSASSPLIRPEPCMVITSDASLTGYGSVCKGVRAGDVWSFEESKRHINELELHAAFIALKAHAKLEQNIHVRLMMDNTTAIACINKMGSMKSDRLNGLSQEIWAWAQAKHIWLSACYIAGKMNVQADEESRKVNIDTEWKINADILSNALSILKTKPIVDLFASRHNFQFTKYVSYRPDPEAFAIDAFSLNWSQYIFYAFPPFCLVSRVIQKVIADGATGIVVVPYWPTQTFYPLLISILVEQPVLVSSRQNLLSLASHPHKQHPLHRKLRLLICKVSGKNIEVKAFQARLSTYVSHLGEMTHEEFTTRISRDGKGTLLTDKWIQFVRL